MSALSTKPRIYLDFNATAPLTGVARDAIAVVLAETLGNPSSIHAEGRRARDRVERARTEVARLVGRPREQIVFTSGGTEANLLGVASLAAAAARRGLPRVIVTSPVEHPSLIAAIRATGWPTRVLPCSPEGEVVADDMLAGAGVVALGLVNHELGTVLAPGVLAAARAAGALIHADAVQAAGKLALDRVEADSVAISAHKLGGPQGVGAVALAAEGDHEAAGHQERGRRGGTENVLGIVGFGAAARDADPEAWPGITALGDHLEAGILAIEGSRIHASGAPRIGGTINAGFTGALGESIVIALDLAGVAASTGAACTSGSVQPSPVLLALGIPPVRAREAVRMSLGRTTTREDIDGVLELLPAIVARARRS
jgi:cysteine desulfurase